MLDDYLKKGGRALFLLSPQKAEEFVAFLQPWGVKVGGDVVVDQVVRSFRGRARARAVVVRTTQPMRSQGLRVGRSSRDASVSAAATARPASKRASW